MASPLDPYINGRFLADNLGTTSISGGRLTYSQPDKYLIKLFIKRAQYGGVSSVLGRFRFNLSLAAR